MLPFHIYDVFTDTPFTGNPLAIVEEADGLTDAQMLTLARQFNLSETIFVQRPVDPAHSARVRIFFPTGEIPFAGHPTIGCALHLSQGQSGRIVLEEEAGIVPVEITAPPALAELRAPVLPHRLDLDIPREMVAAALDLPLDALGQDRISIVSGGPAFLYVPVIDLATLGHARPIEPHWSNLMRQCSSPQAEVDAAYLYTEGAQSDLQARMFSPGAGIPEDPATGSATALLAAQLNDNGRLNAPETHLNLAQGVEMGRPARLFLRITRHDNATLAAVHVAGQAVHVASGEIRVPPA